MERSPGTWRRLKIASEARLGHRIPKLPDAELLRLLGLLAAVRDGRAEAAVADEAEQERAGQAERLGLGDETLADACLRLARAVDVRRFF